MNDVPLIDLTPARHGGRAEREAVAAAPSTRRAARSASSRSAATACPPAWSTTSATSAHAFFALPLADKLRARHPVAGTNRGYHPVGGEALSKANDAAAPPDLKEFFHIGPVDASGDPYYTSALGRQHFMPNIWPAAPAGFAAAATTYYRAMDRLVVLSHAAGRARARRRRGLLRRQGRSIDRHDAPQLLPRAGGAARRRDSSGRAPTPTTAGSRSCAGEDVPGGLQVLTRAGRWIDVATTPETFVVNIGDLLMRWTNDRWLSNLHRVVNPPLGGAAEPAAAVRSPSSITRTTTHSSSACRARAPPSIRPCARASTAI